MPSFRLVRTCEKCGRDFFSDTITTLEQLGSVLEEDVANYHVCPEIPSPPIEEEFMELFRGVIRDVIQESLSISLHET